MTPFPPREGMREGKPRDGNRGPGGPGGPGGRDRGPGGRDRGPGGRDRGPKGPTSPKPFELVRSEQNPSRDELQGHEQFMRKHLLTGRLVCTLDAITPLHIATGAIELGENLGDVKGPPSVLAKEAMKTRGQKFVPGSTLKGTVRSVAEAVTASCIFRTRMKPRVDRNLRECQQIGDVFKLCVACRIFGAPNYQGRVAFSDASLISGDTRVIALPQMHPPNESGHLYELNGHVNGRKFYNHQSRPAAGTMPMEVAHTGSKFQFFISFENLKAEELGLLLSALGNGDPRFNLKLGGGRPFGFGSARVNIEALELNSMFDLYSDWDAKPTTTVAGEEFDQKRETYLKAAANLLVEAQWTRLVSIYTKVVAPPNGPY